jgi:serine/threonine protein kinase
VVASSSHGAGGSSRAERFQLLRELGSRVVPAWAALESLSGDRTRLVVVERVARGGRHGDQDIADWVRDARRLATLEHPGVVRVREVVMRAEDVLVASDFIDGVRWSELTASSQPPSLEVALRVFVDVLSGLSAIHNFRDAKRQPLKLVHGELTPECVLVGLDGVGRVIGAHRMRATTTSDTASAASKYLAPEVLLADDAADGRADVYSVGAMLWEALSGRPIFADTASSSSILTQVLSGQVPRPTVPAAAAWAAPLADVVMRALQSDPAKRFGSAATFAGELRRVGGPKLAPTVRVAAFIRAIHGDAIRVRRERLERGATPREEPSSPEAREEPASIEQPIEVSIEVPIDVAIDTSDRGWTAPPAPPDTTPPLPIVVPQAPPPLPKPRAPEGEVRALKLLPPRAPAATAPPLPILTAVVPAAPPLPKAVALAKLDVIDEPPELPTPILPPAPSPPSPPAPLAPSPPSATASSYVSLESVPIPRERVRAPRRLALVALILAPTMTVGVALAWWLSRPTEQGVKPASLVAPASPSVEARPPAMVVEPPAESAVPSAADIAPEPPAETATAAPSEEALPRPAPPAPVRAIPKPKYDPQGI